jgi:hypothetical protein
MVAQHVIPALGRLRQEDHKYKVSLATKSQKRKKERKKENFHEWPVTLV